MPRERRPSLPSWSRPSLRATAIDGHGDLVAGSARQDGAAGGADAASASSGGRRPGGAAGGRRCLSKLEPASASPPSAALVPRGSKSSPELDGGRRRAEGQRAEPMAAPSTHAQFDFSILWCAPVFSSLTAKHRPDVRRPGAGTRCQQDQTHGRQPTQRSATRGTSPFARDRTGGAPFSCSARLVPESVNAMGELTTNRLWETRDEVCPSQYARMIPGTPAMPRAGVAPPAADAATTHPVNAIKETTAERAVRPMEQLLPHPGDRFTLFQLVTADLLVFPGDRSPTQRGHRTSPEPWFRSPRSLVSRR